MGEARWRDALGNEVDLDDIDVEYALNILTHYTLRCGKRGMTDDDMRANPLVQKLRKTIMFGRQPNPDDIARAKEYNEKCEKRGLAFRA